MFHGEFCATALERLDIFYTVNWALELTWLLLFALLHLFLSSLVVWYWILLPEQLATPDLQVHLEVFLYLGLNMFSSGGSPAVLFFQKGNLILVSGRVVSQTETGLCRSVPGSFSFDFVSSLRILLRSVLSASPSNLAKVPAAHFSLLQSLISSVSLSFSSAFAGFPSHVAFFS